MRAVFFSKSTHSRPITHSPKDKLAHRILGASFDEERRQRPEIGRRRPNSSPNIVPLECNDVVRKTLAKESSLEQLSLSKLTEDDTKSNDMQTTPGYNIQQKFRESPLSIDGNTSNARYYYMNDGEFQEDLNKYNTAGELKKQQEYTGLDQSESSDIGDVYFEDRGILQTNVYLEASSRGWNFVSVGHANVKLKFCTLCNDVNKTNKRELYYVNNKEISQTRTVLCRGCMGNKIKTTND